MTITRDQIGSVRGYTIYQIGLHWLIAALVFAQLVFGESMTEFVEAAEEGEPASALDATLAAEAVRVPAGHADTAGLGPMFGPLSVEKV